MFKAAWTRARVFIAVTLCVAGVYAVYLALGGSLPAVPADVAFVGFWGWAIKLARFITLLVILRLLLKWLDRVLGLDFKTDIWPELTRGNLAVAVYCASRLLAVAILGASFL